MQIKIKMIEHNSKRIDYIILPLIDSLYKMIRETYLGYGDIYLENPIHNNEEADMLGCFLTYILAYPKGIDTPTVHIVERAEEKPEKYEAEYKGRPIVCFSGGVDSTGALLHLLDTQKTPVALWCDYGQPYNGPEKVAVENICYKLNVPLIEAEVDLANLITLGKEKFGHVFPARNLLIAAIALAFLPSEIVLAGLCDELVVPDKSIRMYKEFTHFFGTRLYSPFVKMSKTEVLCVWKHRWNEILDANETISCYSDSGNCQNCSSCAKREVAMIASEYSTQYPEVFANQSQLIEQHWFSRIDDFVPERRDDLLIALLRFKNNLTEKIQRLVEDNYQKYREEVTLRRRYLESLKEIVNG